nr:gluconokinase [Aminobacter sp. AP02]
MGVSGSGKSVVGLAIAEALHASFVEGDMLHPARNIARMANGQALNDSDRQGWLDLIGREIATRVVRGQDVVAACSALKRRYRDQLRKLNPSLRFVHLVLDPATAHRRVLERTGHFMPASLVDSQFADLEPPDLDEAALVLDALLPVDVLAKAAADFAKGGRRP